MEKYTHDSTSLSRPLELQIRREALLTKAQERKVVEEACLRFLFAEARQNVVTGRYPCSAEDATILSAYCLQAGYGDYDASKFIPGYSREAIMPHIPPLLHKAKRVVDWEASVINEYIKLKGRSKLIIHMLFLQYVRQWPIYGSVFYPACKNFPPNGFFELRTDNHLIAVNSEGMLIVDEDKHKIIFSEPYTRLAWHFNEDTVTVEYGTAARSQSLTLITPQAHLVDSLAFEAVRRIERQEREVKRLREAQLKQRST